jgi:hypothetical protein
MVWQKQRKAEVGVHRPKLALRMSSMRVCGITATPVSPALQLCFGILHIKRQQCSPFRSYVQHYSFLFKSQVTCSWWITLLIHSSQLANNFCLLLSGRPLWRKFLVCLQINVTAPTSFDTCSVAFIHLLYNVHTETVSSFWRLVYIFCLRAGVIGVHLLLIISYI